MKVPKQLIYSYLLLMQLVFAPTKFFPSSFKDLFLTRGINPAILTGKRRLSEKMKRNNKTSPGKQVGLSLLKGKTITILGYGNQGRAQALNLRDSGLSVIIGLPEKSRSVKKARQDKFVVRSTEKAVQLGDIVSVLAPDHLHGEIYKREIKPHLQPDKTLLFACGLSVHFKLIVPPDDVDVIMVAPHAPGVVMRNLFVEGKGVPCFISVGKDKSGNAKKTALTYAQAIGCTKSGVFETTFEDEAVGDLFGEQVVLCGGVPELLKAGFEVLIEAGLSPENAYLECVHQLDFIVNTIKSKGFAGMYDRISKTAEYGAYLSGRRIIDKKAKERMTKILKEIKDGSFIGNWIKEYKSGMKNYHKLKQQMAKHPIDKVGRKIRRTSE
jgi:ketol-acid reductoisomerase